MILVYKRYLKRSVSFGQRAEIILSGMPNNTQWRNYYLSHALVSDVWQNWCLFCREVVICSCAGSITRTGHQIPPRPSVNRWKRIAYEANQARKGKPLRPGCEISSMRQEPTWGDQSILLSAIPVLAPANSSTLLSGFGLPVYAPKHIQVVRNSSAHTNSETISGVRQILPLYTGTNFSHPLDILWWDEGNTRTPAIFFWLSELEMVATQVTS